MCIAEDHYLLRELECFPLSGDLDRQLLGIWWVLWELGEGEYFHRLEDECRFGCSGEELGLRLVLLSLGELSRLYSAVREAGRRYLEQNVCIKTSQLLKSSHFLSGLDRPQQLHFYYWLLIQTPLAQKASVMEYCTIVITSSLYYMAYLFLSYIITHGMKRKSRMQMVITHSFRTAQIHYRKFYSLQTKGAKFHAQLTKCIVSIC